VSKGDVEIDHSILSAKNKSDTVGSTGLLFNIDGICEVEDGSVITGACQGMLARGGKVTIKDSTFAATGMGTDGPEPNSWGDQPAEQPYAALLIGNKGSSAYAYSTTVTLTNVTVTKSSDANCYDVYVYQEGTYDVTVSGSIKGSSLTINSGNMGNATYNVNVN